MNPKFIRETIRLIRDYFRLQADVRFLAAILETAVQMDQAPIGWLDALKKARLSPEYRKISEQYLQQLSQLERSVGEKELADLLDTIPPTQFLN